ncbi:MAG: SpoIIE family protein phosphatase [Clostridia bacterium]|nr:SpoIIE family protein phosphatase [Clostridia bacterium]
MHRVLVIDDEQVILENIKFVLELENYEVYTASSAEEGMDIFLENIQNIDAVVTDMRMPRMTGMDVLRKIKELMPEMSVIILTGHGDIENAILAMKEGAFEYLRKPVNADTLAISINNAVNKKNLLLENARMQKEILEQNNYLNSLKTSAQKILLNLLPEKLPHAPGISFSASYMSCEAVGGDMYDVFDAGNKICFYVFDVSGHGILASVITVILRSLIKVTGYLIKSGQVDNIPSAVSEINKELKLTTAPGVFITLFFGFIDKTTFKLEYVSAGHIDQYYCNGSQIKALPSTGTVLGAFEDAQYECVGLQLKPGDKLLLFTDGVTEAASGSSLFGSGRLLEIIERNKENDIGYTVKDIQQAVTDFSGGNIVDDVTILGVEIF